MQAIPTVKTNFLTGTYQFFKDPIGTLEKTFNEYGDTYKISLLMRSLIVSRDPKVLEHTFVRSQRKYDKDFSMEQISLALGKGLLTNTGDSWLRQRRLAQPAFYKKRLDALAETMEEITDRHIDKLRRLRSGHKIFIDQEMITLTATIALKTLLGEDMTPEMKHIQSAIATTQEYIIKRIRIPFYTRISELDGSYKRFNREMEEMDKIIYEIIRRKRASQAEDNDLISMLIASKDADTGETMSDKQLRDETITIYVAGHETSAYALSWTFYELMQNPDVYQKVRAEVQEILGENGKLRMDELKALKYTTAVINESMRLHPPAYLVSRVCLEDDVIDDITIKKNESVLISLIGMHKNPEVWEDADGFRPERFLTPSEATRKHFHPFGAGPRMCIGNHFAMMEITIILAKIVATLDFKLVPGQKIEAQPLITLKPKYGIKLMKL